MLRGWITFTLQSSTGLDVQKENHFKAVFLGRVKWFYGVVGGRVIDEDSSERKKFKGMKSGFLSLAILSASSLVSQPIGRK